MHIPLVSVYRFCHIYMRNELSKYLELKLNAYYPVVKNSHIKYCLFIAVSFHDHTHIYVMMGF